MRHRTLRRHAIVSSLRHLVLNAFLVWGCARTASLPATEEPHAAPGTYRIALFRRDSAVSWRPPQYGVLVMQQSPLPSAVRRTLERADEFSAAEDGPSLGEACFRWEMPLGTVSGTDIPTPPRARTTWRTVRGDTLHLMLFETIDASYQVLLGPTPDGGWSGRGDRFYVRLASDTDPPQDSIRLDRVGPPDPARCTHADP
jgi:hypothetical protein